MQITIRNPFKITRSSSAVDLVPTGTNPLGWFNWFKDYKKNYGVRVTPASAEGFSAVYACLNYKFGTIAAQPLKAYKKTTDHREDASKHPFSKIIRGRANKYQLFSKWLYTMGYDLELWGDGISKRDYDQRGRLIGYTPWKPFHVTFEDDNGRLMAKNHYTKEYIPYDDIIHFADNFDYVTKRGRSRINIARNGIELAMNAENFGVDFFNKGTNISGALKYPNTLTKEQAELRLKHWKQEYGGIENMFKVALMDGGATFERFNMPMADAQYIQQREFGMVDVARIFNVEPIKIKDHSRSTFSNIVELNISSVTDTLLPVAVYMEQLLNEEFVTSYDHEPGEYFVKHNFNALVRGNPEQQSKLIDTMMKWGLYDENRVMKIMDEEPVDNSTRRVPLNMIPAELVDDYIKAKIENLLKGGKDKDGDSKNSNSEEE